MKRYDIDSLKIEQSNLFSEIRRYISTEALCEEIHKVELKLFRLLLALGLCLLKEVIALRGTGKDKSVIRDQAGDSYRYHCTRNRDYLSIFGLVHIERAYYRAEGGGGGIYPLDAELNLPATRYSYLLQQWTHSEVVETTYDHAVNGISELLDIAVWKRGQEDALRARTVDIDEYYRQKPPPDPTTEGEVICVTADCKGVRMVPSEKPEQGKPDTQPKARRGKGDKRSGLRKDAVVTSDFSFNPSPRTPEEVVAALMKEDSSSASSGRDRDAPKPGETGSHPREPLNKQTFAHMNGKAEAFAKLLDRVGHRDPTGSKPIYVLLDGDPALANRLLEEIRSRGWEGRLVGIGLDIIHVMEYLWEAGTALYGETSPQRRDWVYRTAVKIMKGDVGRVIGGLKQRAAKVGKRKKRVLGKVICYFTNHRKMMTYDRFLASGYPIATGVIEGACGSLVKNRTDGSGMRWTKTGVQAVLDLRAIKRNGDWDPYWNYHLNQEKQRLYHAA